MNRTYPLAVAALLLLAGGAWWWAQRDVAQGPRYQTAKLERGPLLATVAASGAVNPVTQVSVGTQVSGQIKDLFVDFNSEVKAGQLIAVIDPETFEYKVRQAQADVDAAASAVLTAQATVAASQAAVSRARVDLQEARRDHERKASLAEKQFIAQSEVDRASALVNTSVEAVKATEAQLGVTQAQVGSAQANVAQREAALAQARVDLARTRITSPVAGIVVKRAVERGQTVAASLQAPELFVIAQNLRDMQVEASVDEADVGRIRTGQKASFTVDAFAGQNFEGSVRQLRKSATNLNSVVTYVAVIGFANRDGRLLPGMTANVRIVTDAREDVLRVPNAALRVRLPAAEERALAARTESAGQSGATVTAATTGPVDGVPSKASIAAPAASSAAVSAEASAGSRARLYVLGADGKPRAVAVRIGISDGSNSELLSTDDAGGGAALAEGDSVVRAVVATAPAKSRLPF